MDHKQTVVTRIPPSPTGHFHIGTARTALFNYLFAKKHDGHMVFRSEDTDRARGTRTFEDEIVAGLAWLGLIETDIEIIRQSERGAIYREKLEQIIASDRAYISTEPSKQNPNEMVSVVRLRNPNKDITFNDLVRGDITFNTTELGDVVIARSVDDALYHFTVVVDDELMGVTHVIRGEDHISNTPRQILIQEALGYSRPLYAHLPLILATDRSKMSKRHGAVAINEYKDEGFTKEAIINYLALLGWNPGTEQELFSLEELVTAFDVTKIQKSGAIFNIDKFKWFNREYLARLSDNEYVHYLEGSVPSRISSLASYSSAQLKKLIPLIKERTHTRTEFAVTAEAGEYDFAFEQPVYETELLKWKNDNTVTAALPRLQNASELLATADFSSPETIKTSLLPYAETEGKGEVFWPMRIALSGKAQSPDPFTIAYIIGRTATLERIATACDKIGGDVQQ